jgi:hypothetical protein
MDPLIVAGLTIVLALVVGLLVWQWQRSTRLRSQFAHEYDRARDELGRLRAQRELASRERRVRRLNLRPITLEERNRFATNWQAIQAQFVDDPAGAVAQGDRLVEDVMDARGYPPADFDQRIADLSVHHARIADDYRAIREIAHRHRRQEATTEDLRRVLIHFRAVFEDMLETREPVADRVVERKVEREHVRPLGTPRVETFPDSEHRA